ncbi:MAG: hypothetical protein GXY67_14430 [Clostridiales bacterium]|nr:hypothetical protein [Clostridiales bacterium]
MPKLILQPLVENCIAHGYVEKEAVHITITASQIGQDIQIRVVDNGDGIPDARLEEIKAQLDFVCQETKHVGLFNSHRRLQLMYGKRYGVQITSVPKVGTEVMLSFPVNGCEPKETPEGGESDV